MIKATLERWLDRAEGHYLLVLLSLISVFVVAPFVDTHSWAVILVDVAFAVALLTSLLAAVGRRYWPVVLALSLISQLLISGDFTRFIALDTTWGNLLRAGLFFLITGAILRNILQFKVVTMNAVYGACSAYLMMALAWFRIYVSIEALVPGSFKFPDVAPGLDSLGFEGDLAYFSLITMSTVGYGDIVPVAIQARMIAALQGVIGQLYLAVILARIVSMEIAQRVSRRQS